MTQSNEQETKYRQPPTVVAPKRCRHESGFWTAPPKITGRSRRLKISKYEVEVRIQLARNVLNYEHVHYQHGSALFIDTRTGTTVGFTTFGLMTNPGELCSDGYILDAMDSCDQESCSLAANLVEYFSPTQDIFV